MNQPIPQKPTAKSGQHPGASESPESIETFPSRTKRPGQVGLANEARPGLGTRMEETGQADPEVRTAKTPPAPEPEATGRDVPKPPEERPEPSEQDSDSFAQEQQRETGVSGHSGST